MFIKDYIETLQEDGAIGAEVAKVLGVSEAMVSCYKNQGYNPSLKVAKTVYQIEGIILHPFSEEGLKFEKTIVQLIPI